MLSSLTMGEEIVDVILTHYGGGNSRCYPHSLWGRK